MNQCVPASGFTAVFLDASSPPDVPRGLARSVLFWRETSKPNAHYSGPQFEPYVWDASLCAAVSAKHAMNELITVVEGFVHGQEPADELARKHVAKRAPVKKAS
jgi:hypothetical protein